MTPGIISFLLSLLFLAQSHEGAWKFQTQTPKWVRREFGARHMEKEYALTYQLFPSYLEGDFNGDGRRDVAVLLQQKSTGKMGIAIFHGKRAQAISTTVTILGAGHELGGAGDDFHWANAWSFIPADADSMKSMFLKGDAIHLERRDSTRGVISWDGHAYEWTRRKK